MIASDRPTPAASRERIDYDIVIVGAGPAGLAAAIRVKQLDPAASVVVLEKGSEPGGHILSGAVMGPRAIGELLPDWQDRGAPLNQPVTGDEFLFLGRKRWLMSTPTLLSASLLASLIFLPGLLAAGLWRASA